METILLVGSYSAAYYPPLDCYVIRNLQGTALARTDSLELAAILMQTLQEPSTWN